MSDFGDDMRAWRARKQKVRASMIVCDACGHDGYKIFADFPCSRCGSTRHMTAKQVAAYEAKKAKRKKT